MQPHLIAHVKPSLNSTKKRSNLFDGPTLIQVTPPRNSNAFCLIRRSVKQGSSDYQRYIECKAFAKAKFEFEFVDEIYVSDMEIVEPHDKRSVILFSTDNNDRVDGMLRICTDSAIGVPMAKDVSDVVTEHRRRGLLFGEPGRFSQASAARTFRRMVSAAYAIATYTGMYAYLMQCRLDHQSFYEQQVGAETLPHPAPEGCVNMIWRIRNTPEKFLHRFGRTQEQLEALVR